MAKRQYGGLQGPGNTIKHQLVISDLIFGVRKRFLEKHWSKKYSAVSEISVSELGYMGFEHNHNIDFLIYDKRLNTIKLILEVERKGKSMTRTKKKIKECLLNIPDIEAFIVQINPNDINFISCSLDNKGKLVMKENKSRSKLLNKNLKSILISI